MCKRVSADGLLVVGWHAVGEFDDEVAQGAGPVSDRESPSGADVSEAQVEELE